MSRTSQAFTIQIEPSPFAPTDIHSRSTRILKNRRTSEEHRRTVVSPTATPGDRCRACAADLEGEAQFCGFCGQRVRARRSLTGTILDDLYQIEARIAEGATATIYRARYLPTGEALALKVLHPELAYEPQAAARFRREARCLARLRDTRIVTVFDHGEAADGTAYIAMELLRGEGLAVRSRTRGAMPWRQALSIVRDICGALVAVHAQGIVHRNLSLSNVMLVAGDAVKLIDFGLAKQRADDGDEELTRIGQTIGVLSHAAPEQLAGRRCDARVDLYALGVICCELLAGGLPPGEPSTTALPQTTPRQLVELVRRCLASDREKRFSNASELAHAIDQLLAPIDPVQTPLAVPRHRRIYGHTPAFELEPPKLPVLPERELPELARGSQPEVTPTPQRRSSWKLWAVALVVCGVGLGTAVAGCV